MTIKTKLKSYSALVASIGAVGTSEAQSGIYQSFDAPYYSAFLDLDKDGVVDLDITYTETSFQGAYRAPNRYGAVQALQSSFSVGNLSSGYLVELDSLDAINSAQRDFVQQGEFTNVQYGVYYNTWISYRTYTTYSGYVSLLSYFYCVGNQSTINHEEWNNGYLALKKVVDGNTYYGWLRMRQHNWGGVYIKDAYLSLDPDRTVLAGEALGPVSTGEFIKKPSVSLLQNNREIQIARDFASSGMELRLYDMMGRMIKFNAMANASQTFSFNSVPSGVYILKITSEGYDLKTEKVVFQ